MNRYDEIFMEGYYDGLAAIEETPKCDCNLSKKAKIKARAARQQAEANDRYLQLKSGRTANIRKRFDYDKFNHNFNPRSTTEYHLNEEEDI